jgi:hypothetical protein
VQEKPTNQDFNINEVIEKRNQPVQTQSFTENNSKTNSNGERHINEAPNKIHKPNSSAFAFPPVFKTADTTFEKFKKQHQSQMEQEKRERPNQTRNVQAFFGLGKNNNNNNEANSSEKNNQRSFLKWRFDFNGKILSEKEQQEIPTYLGLHHHAEEYEKAGTFFRLKKLKRKCKEKNKKTKTNKK